MYDEYYNPHKILSCACGTFGTGLHHTEVEPDTNNVVPVMSILVRSPSACVYSQDSAYLVERGKSRVLHSDSFG